MFIFPSVNCRGPVRLQAPVKNAFSGARSQSLECDGLDPPTGWQDPNVRMGSIGTQLSRAGGALESLRENPGAGHRTAPRKQFNSWGGGRLIRA
jgi:hypothetical protein